MLCAAMLCAATGCGRSRGGEDAEVSELRYEGSTGAVTFMELAEDLGYLAPLKLNFVGNTISGPQNIQNVVTGDVDIGGAFNGAVIKLVAAGAPIQAVIGLYGADELSFMGFYTLADGPIHGPRDLIGKKIAMNTLGAHSEFMLREYLTRAGLSADEIAQVTMVVVPPVNSEQALRQHHVDVAALQNMLRDQALERGGLRRLVSDYELFGKFTAGSLVMNRAFIAKHPATVRRFVQGTAKAIEWARNNPREVVIARFEKIIARRGRSEDASILKYWQSTGIASTGGIPGDRDFSIWIDWLVRDGQLQRGQVKPADVYTTRFFDHEPSAARPVAQQTGG